MHFGTYLPTTNAGWRSRLSTTLGAGIWLVFLSPTLIQITQPTQWIAAGGFMLVYLSAFQFPSALDRLPRPAYALVYTVILAALWWPVAGIGGTDLDAVMNAVPFILAVWVFSQRFWLGTSIAIFVALASIALDGFSVIIVPVFFVLLFRFFLEYGAIAEAQQREEMADLVHDALGQTLTSVTVKTQLARRLVDADPSSAKRELDEILGLTRQSLAEVRITASGLRVPNFSEQLAVARKSLTDTGITVSVPDEIPPLTPARTEVFAAVLREAVTNIIRHSQATTCTIEMDQDRLLIADNGVGTDQTPGFARRVERSGGKLQVTGPGTRVEVSL